MNFKEALEITIDLAGQGVVDEHDDADGNTIQNAAIDGVTKLMALLEENPVSIPMMSLATILGMPIALPGQEEAPAKDLDKAAPKPTATSIFEARATEVSKMESIYEDKEFETAGWAAEYEKLRAFFKEVDYHAQTPARNASKVLEDGKGKVLTYIQHIVGFYEDAAKKCAEAEAAKAAQKAKKDEFAATLEGVDLAVFDPKYKTAPQPGSASVKGKIPSALAIAMAAQKQGKGGGGSISMKY